MATRSGLSAEWFATRGRTRSLGLEVSAAQHEQACKNEGSQNASGLRTGHARRLASLPACRGVARRLQNCANDLGRQPSTLSFQAGLSRSFILFDRCPRLLHLGLRLGPRFRHRGGPSLQRQLATRFLALE